MWYSVESIINIVYAKIVCPYKKPKRTMTINKKEVIQLHKVPDQGMHHLDMPEYLVR